MRLMAEANRIGWASAEGVVWEESVVAREGWPKRER